MPAARVPASTGRTSTRVLGLELDNPVLVASGSLSDSLAQIVRALKTGAGGVVTKTIYAGEDLALRERVRVTPGEGAFNNTTYSHRKLDEWVRALHTVRERRLPVIVSIHGPSPESLARLAQVVVEAGAPALELGICCPIDPQRPVADWRTVEAYTRALRAAVPVPFAVKLIASGGVLVTAKAAIAEGADAISVSDSLPGLLVDPTTRTLPLGSAVGYSGPPIKPIVLHSIYEMRQAGISCPILAIGGVASAKDVLEYLLTGADAVQLLTMLLKKKVQLLSTIIDELTRWLKNERTTVREIVGTVEGPLPPPLT